MAKKQELLTLALAASGGGTDADAVMKAWKAGLIPQVGRIILISTVKGAGCLSKAKVQGVHTKVIPGKAGNFQKQFAKYIQKQGVALVFLVGCIHKVPLIRGVPIYNIHPANTKKHGGNTMYGLKVHKHVLRAILDKLERGCVPDDGRFFTQVTVHEVNAEHDKGRAFLMLEVEIPQNIINRLIAGTIKIGEAVKKLQQEVLPYEWALLPTAVNLAAKKILDAK